MQTCVCESLWFVKDHSLIHSKSKRGERHGKLRQNGPELRRVYEGSSVIGCQMPPLPLELNYLSQTVQARCFGNLNGFADRFRSQ
ncbi:unnamed protein product [Caenorhabditis auriculariae]|uniref:Uncharacterized protein n=1 Tax=Caenorhabditis auriculariae TaxID=2777116 RepID=A0A8S1HA89_9PELO|nr:unnamed protein product [Caenorhabditis auriculariae]